MSVWRSRHLARLAAGVRARERDPMQAERIQRLARDERLARHAGFWWGFAEGLFFVIVPDVYISFAALFSLRAGAVAWVASIAGSALAACGIYVLTSVGVEYLAFLQSIPGISGALLGRVGQRLAAEGLPYTPWLVLGDRKSTPL